MKLSKVLPRLEAISFANPGCNGMGRPEFVSDFDPSGGTISPIDQQDQSLADACIAAESAALCAR
jgi:hypothetical protein